MKKILYNNINKTVSGIVITKFDVHYNENVREILKKIIAVLTIGKNYYFQFRSEDDFFIEKHELIKYRKYIPEYFDKQGKYKILYKKREGRFDAVGMLAVNNLTNDFILDLWKYYSSMSFFSSDSLEWDNYIEIIPNKIRDINGIKLLRTGKADHIFIKGDMMVIV